MNDAQIHLALNHIPILGSLFGVILLAYGIIRSSKSITHAGYVTMVVVALITFVVVNTGQGAEDIVEDLGINHDLIEEHEELAHVAFWLMEALGLLSVIGFILSFQEHKARRIISIVTLVFGIVVFVYMGRVGAAGGEIHHPEVRENASTD